EDRGLGALAAPGAGRVRAPRQREAQGRLLTPPGDARRPRPGRSARVPDAWAHAWARAGRRGVLEAGRAGDDLVRPVRSGRAAGSARTAGIRARGKDDSR